MKTIIVLHRIVKIPWLDRFIRKVKIICFLPLVTFSTVSANDTIAFHHYLDIEAGKSLVLELNYEFSLHTRLNFVTAPIQNPSISGTITDSDGVPLPGATVVQKGTNNGSQSDFDGNYSITLDDGNAVLIFSYIGMKTQEIKVVSQTEIDVTLEEGTSLLDEVVIVGFGSQKKINLTGSVGVIESEPFETRPVTNVQQSLQGQVPGLFVNQAGGQPGDENFELRIRGNSTFSDNPPLVIVDGIAMSMNALNPHDIESVSVLKDAASTAIYGARASGGVILVTTKKGKAGKIRVSYDAYTGFQNPTNLPETLSAFDHVTLFTEGELNNNPETTVFKYPVEERERFRTGVYPSNDKIDYMFNPAAQTNHNLSISGGSEINRFYLSVGYLDQEGIFRNTSSERLNLRLNNNIRLNDRLDLDINVQYTPTTVNGPSEASYPSGPSRRLENIIYDGTYRFGQDEGIKNSDGTWSSVAGFANRLGLGSPDGGFQERKFNRLSGVFAANYRLTDGLTLNAQYGAKIDNTRQVDYSKRIQFINPRDLTDVDFDYDINSLLIQNTNNDQHNFQLLTNYNKIFGESHDFKALLGFSQEWNNNTYDRVGRRNFVTDEIFVIDAGSSDPTNWDTGGDASEWAIQSYFGRLNYNFKDRYLLEANLRYDGSSRFSSDTRWGLFPSVSAGWRINQESFMDNVDWISNLKVRGSWGQVGNQNIDLYQYYSTIANSAYYFNGVAQTASYYDESSNVDLQWETKTTTNIGLDIGLFKNKLTMVFDVFKDRTSDILMRPTVPITFGLGSPVQNVATIDNKGWEAQISYRDKKGDFSYGVSFNISDANNEIVSMVNSPQIRSNRISEVGFELEEWYGYRSLGIFGSQEELDAYPARLDPSLNGTGIGDLKIEDLDGDGEITADDRQRLGSSIARFPYGGSIELGWKGFDFSAFIQGVGKREVYLTRAAAVPFRLSIETAQVRHLDRWRLADDGTTWIPGKFPKTRIGGANTNTFSSFWLQDASYLRLKNIQLGYSLPASFLSKINIERLRLYVSGENILTFSKLYGFDPEAPNGQGNYYPQSSVLTLGINLTF